MITSTKQLTERFSDLDLFRMFNIELEEGNDTCELSAPLWTVERRAASEPRSRAQSLRIDGKDKIKPGITDAGCGTAARIEALAAFYANAAEGESAFED